MGARVVFSGSILNASNASKVTPGVPDEGHKSKGGDKYIPKFGLFAVAGTPSGHGGERNGNPSNSIILRIGYVTSDRGCQRGRRKGGKTMSGSGSDTPNLDAAKGAGKAHLRHYRNHQGLKSVS